MVKSIIHTFIVFITIYTSTFATIINVPGDQPEIQAGIDASAYGDTVLVQPGIYIENVSINGRNIVLGSLYLTTGDTSYISQTIIDGDSSGSVISIEFCTDTITTVTGFTIQNGFAEDGGGIYCYNSKPRIINNRIFNNHAEDQGGGICEGNYSFITIKNNLITGNSARWGGGIYESSSYTYDYNNVKVTSNVIMNNLAEREGGGGFLQDLAVNNIFIQNHANKGGGASIRYSVFCNNVMFENTADVSGGGLYSINSVVINSIFWADSSAECNEIGPVNNDNTVSYSNVQGGYTGIGNIDIDPLFRDPENEDYHLMAIACGDPFDSPCIDAGAPNIVDTLLDCSWGLATTASDIGAYGGGQRFSTTINIPDDYSTIQTGINAGIKGDTVLVQPGTYYENIRWNFKPLTVGSLFLTTRDTSYISSTIIDGGNIEWVLVAQGPDWELAGFTLQHGQYDNEGGIWIGGDNAIFRDNIVRWNGDDYYSYVNPAMSCYGGCSVLNNVFTENEAYAIVALAYSNPNMIIANNLFTDNNYGGIFCSSGDPLIINNIFTDHSAEREFEAAFRCIYSDAILLNNTFANNICDSGAMIVADAYSVLSVVNNIIWDNTGPSFLEIGSSSIIVEYCNDENGHPGQGNISIDPLFRDPANGDYHLMSTACGDPYDSPCIDIGHPEVIDSLMDCDWGLGTGLSDMGAYGGGESFNHTPITIDVPYDYPTIQEAIDHSMGGDTILIQPGTYYENLNISNKYIILGSLFLTTGDKEYITSTIVDGDSSARVIVCDPGHDSTSVICGLTIQHGNWSFNGSGIICEDCNIIIRNNIIKDNYTYSSSGPGIYFERGYAIIQDNIIFNNLSAGNSAGGGIYIKGDGEITGNVIANNSAHQGGGMYCHFSTDLLIERNTIVSNSALRGNGLFIYNAFASVKNNIVWSEDTSAVYLFGSSNPNITYCDVYGGWSGEGNIDCDPMFCNPDSFDYSLNDSSCCVGAGEEGSNIGALGIGCGLSYDYLPGDVNMTNAVWPPTVIGSDVTYLVNYFRGFPENSPCLIEGLWLSADANGDCIIIGSDVTRLVTYFRGLAGIIYCPEYQPAWQTPDDLPTEAPEGWPNCE